MPIRVKQVRSSSKATAPQAETLNALGLKGLNSVSYRKDTNAIRGMLNRVHHLIQADLVDESEANKKTTKVSNQGYSLG